VGKKWTHRFVEINSDHIRMAWTMAMEKRRGLAMDPITVAAWNKLYGPTIIEYEIQDHNMYGSDEIDVTGSSSQRNRSWVHRRKVYITNK